jgi:hypothetical protein
VPPAWYRPAVEPIARLVGALAGAFLIVLTIRSVIRTFVLPRMARDRIVQLVFRNVRRIFDLVAGPRAAYATRDRYLAFFAPVALLVLPVINLALLLTGYALIYWGLGVDPETAVRQSGSALLTLGFQTASDLPTTLLAFTEAAFGLILVALLIAYLPSMYADFTRRETEVNLLGVRAGTPASSVFLLELAHRISGMERLDWIWERWERWFAELEETHTTLPALAFFRSPRPEQSWVSAAGAVLDAAALRASTLDQPRDPQVETCIRAGYLALTAIADFFALHRPLDPKQGDPISIPRREFDAAYDRLRAAGIAVKPDRNQAWRDFAGWRVNYDAALLGIARVVVVPPTPWIHPGVPHPGMTLQTEPVPSDLEPGLVNRDDPVAQA